MTKARIRFYNSKQWIRMRNYIKIKYKGTCQVCGNRGTHVHHIEYITDANITDPNITLNENNLTLLCHNCHNMEHMDTTYLRNDVEFDDQGQLIKRIKAPPYNYKKARN